MFKTKINVVENSAINANDKDYIKRGTWAFSVPVTVNKDLKKEIVLDNEENDFVKIDSIKTTPFKTVLKVNFKKEDWLNCNIKVLDKNNKELRIEKIVPNKNNQKGTYEEVGSDIIFDKIIDLNR